MCKLFLQFILGWILRSLSGLHGDCKQQQARALECSFCFQLLSHPGEESYPFVQYDCYPQGSLIHNEDTRPSYVHKMLDPDMALMASIRAKGEFIYVTNRLNFGHLVNAEDFETSHLHNELWEIERNRYDWELRYLHPNYSASMGLENPEQPCPDVYWFPMFTERFCNDFVAEAEHFGKWSDGSNNVSI